MRLYDCSRNMYISRKTRAACGVLHVTAGRIVRECVCVSFSFCFHGSFPWRARARLQQKGAIRRVRGGGGNSSGSFSRKHVNWEIQVLREFNGNTSRTCVVFIPVGVSFFLKMRDDNNAGVGGGGFFFLSSSSPRVSMRDFPDGCELFNYVNDSIYVYCVSLSYVQFEMSKLDVEDNFSS